MIQALLKRFCGLIVRCGWSLRHTVKLDCVAHPELRLMDAVLYPTCLRCWSTGLLDLNRMIYLTRFHAVFGTILLPLSYGRYHFLVLLFDPFLGAFVIVCPSCKPENLLHRVPHPNQYTVSARAIITTTTSTMNTSGFLSGKMALQILS